MSELKIVINIRQIPSGINEEWKIELVVKAQNKPTMQLAIML